MKLFYCTETNHRCHKEACPFFVKGAYPAKCDRDLLEERDFAFTLSPDLHQKMNNSMAARPREMFR